MARSRRLKLNQGMHHARSAQETFITERAALSWLLQAACPGELRFVAMCHEAAGPLRIPLTQIALRTWSGVSSCGASPVSVNSWNFAIGMALA